MMEENNARKHIFCLLLFVQLISTSVLEELCVCMVDMNLARPCLGSGLYNLLAGSCVIRLLLLAVTKQWQGVCFRFLTCMYMMLA
jgi:hypothetical protein